MAQTPRQPRLKNANGLKTVRPGQDIALSQKQGGQFPTVGMTLRSYQYDSSDKHKYPAGRGVVVKNTGRFRDKFTLKRLAITLAMIVLLIGGWVGGKFIYNAHKLFGGNILSVLSNSKLDGEDKGRVNILLAGNSADDVGHNGGELTDSIMIVSLDTKNNKAFMFSIPRDLWVNIPDEGHAKINEVYVDGKADKFSADGYPDGGMGLLEQVVEENFGLDINYYSLVNYKALKKAVDAVGGVDFTVKSDDPRGLYDPNIDYSTGGPLVKLTNGVHHLNGQQALNLSRARGDSYRSYGFAASDFTRTENQRKLLIALKIKAASAGVVSNPAKLTSLADAIGGNVKTDFKIDEVKRLYELSKKIDLNNIKSVGLNDNRGQSLLDSYTARGGQSALIPAAGLDDFSDIQSFIRRQTSSNPIVQEGARVVVLNATDISGLASKQKSALTAKGLSVNKVGDANINSAASSIIDVSGGKMPKTRQVLVTQYGNSVTTTNPYANMYDADFIVLIGSDKAGSSTKTQQ